MMRVNVPSKATRLTAGALALGLLAALPAAAQQTMAEPTVKQDGEGRCIDKTHDAYESTKLFMPFRSMAECVRAGGKKAE